MEGNRHSASAKDDCDVALATAVSTKPPPLIKAFFRRPCGVLRKKILKMEVVREARELSRADVIIAEDENLTITSRKSDKVLAYFPWTEENIPAVARILTQLNITSQSLAQKSQPKRFEHLAQTITSIRQHPVIAVQQDSDRSHRSSSTVRDVYQLSLKSASLEQLLKNILGIKKFKRHDSCQLLIHPKGHPSFISYLYNRHDGLIQGMNQIGDFHSIYNLVKKSKSKHFDQTNLLKDTLGIVGTFLAKEFRLERHDVILILSRNSFIKDDPEDQKYFELLALPIARILDRILQREQLERRQTQIQALLESYPHPLAINDSKNNTIFCNKRYDANRYRRLQPIQIDREYQLLLQEAANTAIDSEIYHHHRITLLGELLNTLRHELSNPLFGVQLNSDLLISELEGHNDLDLIMDLAKSCYRCQDIIKGFSDLYKNEKSISSFDLKNLIEQVTTLCKSESREIRKNIIYDSSIADGPFFIKSNPTWITQIIFNLIINSAQAVKTKATISPQDRISVTCHISKGRVIISVSDSGPGIGPDIQRQIFDPFFTTKHKGTGLGLSICYSLALRLGGGIYFFNNLNTSGATFTLTLPYEYINR
jgi:two-component system, NtrC family, sensor kinase